MSIFDELLVLIDDHTEVRTEKIEVLLPHYNRQAIGSTLGRLVSRGWIERRSDTSNGQYRMAPVGNEYLNSILSTIRYTEQPWDNTWFAVVILLDDNQRRARDIIRRYLASHGFGAVVDGLWLSPWNQQEAIQELIRRLGIGSALITFTMTSPGPATVQMLVQKSWDWAYLDRQFTELAETLTTRVEKLEQDAKNLISSDDRARLRLGAKGCVFDYGLLLQSDPNLPLTIAPDSIARRKLRDLYQRVRPLCYQ